MCYLGLGAYSCSAHPMSTLLSFLCLISSVCLVIGLAHPSTFNKSFKGQASRKKLGLAFGFSTLVFLIGIGVFAPRVDKTSSSVLVGDSATSTMSNEDQIKAVVASVLEGKTNLSHDERLKAVDVVPQIDGGWGVFVELNADENFTPSLTKGGIEKEMSDVYMALYSVDRGVRTASVAAYLPTADKYGNASKQIVYKSILGVDEARKVNWATDKATLELQILPEVWETPIKHSF